MKKVILSLFLFLMLQSVGIAHAKISCDEARGEGYLTTTGFRATLREWGWGFKRFFSFGSEAKINTEMAYLDQAADRFSALSECDESVNAEAIEKVADNYAEARERLVTQISLFPSSEADLSVQTVVAKATEQVLAHEEVFNDLESKALEVKHDVVKNSIGNVRKEMPPQAVFLVAQDKVSEEQFLEIITSQTVEPAKAVIALSLLATPEEAHETLQAKEEISGAIQGIEVRPSLKAKEAVIHLIQDSLQAASTEEKDKIAQEIRSLPPVKQIIVSQELQSMVVPPSPGTTQSETVHFDVALPGVVDAVTVEQNRDIQTVEELKFLVEAKLKTVRGLRVGAPEGVVVSIIQQMLEQAEKHYQEGSQALAQGKLGEAFGQFTSALASLRKAEGDIQTIESVEVAPDQGGAGSEAKPLPTVDGRVTTGGCVITGCSSQICSDQEVMSTCEYRPEYVCYKNTRCERQASGKCGWTPTSELALCVEKHKSLNTKIETPSLPTVPDVEKPVPLPHVVPPSTSGSSGNLIPSGGDTRVVELESATLQVFTVEADDSGFYPSVITVPKGATIKVVFVARKENVYYGGIDFRSSKFKTDTAKAGQSVSVEFSTNESFVVSSYWPASGVKKAEMRVEVK